VVGLALVAIGSLLVESVLAINHQIDKMCFEYRQHIGLVGGQKWSAL
jgi:hypothetical protein